MPWSFNPGMSPRTDWIGSWVGLSVGLEDFEYRNFLWPSSPEPSRHTNSFSVRYKMKIYVQIRRKLLFKIPMLNQIDSPYGVRWIAKTKNQDWDAMKINTLVATLLFCHAIQIVSALYKKRPQNMCCMGYHL